MITELSNERIDAMRTHVLDAVDADITRRGRRARNALMGGVGALALVTVLGLTFPAITGGSPDSGNVASGPTSTERMAKPAPQAADGALSNAEAAPDMAVTPDGRDLTAAGKNREVITTGSATVVVKDTSASANRFTVWVEKHHGRVDGRTESRDDAGHTSATLTIRVPGKYVSAAVRELRENGTVKAVDLQRDDVTAEGRDLDARIKALQISVDRLERILAQAGSSREVIEAETALSERQQELESLQTERRSLSDQVSLSTIDVSFVQESKPGSVAPGGFRGGLIKGWNALVDTVNAIVTAAGAALPWLGVAALVGLGWWGIRKARRK